MSPFRKQWLVWSAARDVAANGHGTKRAAVIALAAGNDAEFLRRSGFEMKLSREFDCGFGGFGAAGGEIDATICEIRRSESE